MGVCATVSKGKLQRTRLRAVTGRQPLKSQRLRFAHLKAHPNRVQGHDRCEGRRGAARHQPAHLNQAVPDAAADWGTNRRVLEVKFRGLRQRAIRFHLRVHAIDLR